jgi:cysteine synthase
LAYWSKRYWASISSAAATVRFSRETIHRSAIDHFVSSTGSGGTFATLAITKFRATCQILLQNFRPSSNLLLVFFASGMSAVGLACPEIIPKLDTIFLPAIFGLS